MEFSFQFMKPYYLLIIPFAAALIIFLGLKRPNRSKFAKIMSIIVRTIIVTTLVFSLADLNIKSVGTETATIFVLDISDSVSNKEKAKEFINESLKHKNRKDLTGVVCFGSNSVIESMPSKDIEFYQFDSFVEDDFTNISLALNMARSVMPEKTKKHIILLSDGLENVDSAELTAKTLSSENVVIDVFQLDDLRDMNSEVQLTNIRVPKYLNKDVEHEVEVDIYSLSETNSTIFLYKGSTLISKTEAILRKGDNKFVFRDVSDVGGGIIYRAEVLTEEDFFEENNIAYAHTYVADIPNILLLDYKESSKEMEKMLSQSKVNLKTISSVAAPNSIDKISAYDAIIINDVPYEYLPDGFDELLEQYVKNIGGGVFVTGGENSYGPGGYLKTKLEDILPVDMELKDKSKVPDLGMVVCIDRSGSMSSSGFGVSKLELAKEAVIRSVETLNEQDKFGVIAFDDSFQWIAPFEGIEGRKDEVTGLVASISLGGGTSILPSLQQAAETLTKADTKLKHIVLLTDGQDSGVGYDAVIKKLNDEGITLSTVAVGSDSDTALLQRLAEGGNGRYYYSDEFTDLPHIFAKETFLAGKTYFVNRTFYPILNDVNVLMSGINSLPMLDGYVATSPKTRADIVLKSDSDDPVLASWQYGLGRTVAWTSDIDGRWASSYLTSNEGVSLFRNVTSWLIKKQNSSSATIDVKTSGKNSEVTLTFPFSDGVEKVNGKIIDSENKEIPVEFKADAPGVFKANLAGGDAGAYVASLELNKLSGAENITMGFSVPYSEEYNVRNNQGAIKLNKIIAISDGIFIEKPEDVFRPLDINVIGDISIAFPLLLFALLLLVFDIAARRFTNIYGTVESTYSDGKQKLSDFSDERHQKKLIAKREEKINKLEKIGGLSYDIEVNTSSVSPTSEGKTKKNDKDKKVSKETEKENISDLLIKQKKNRMK